MTRHTYWTARFMAAGLLVWAACSKEAGFGPGEIPPTQDTDEDGVPDVSEDRNQNGTVDPGETNPASTDSDGDGLPDDQEVSYLACSKVNDRPIAVYDVPGADSMLMVDAAVAEHSTLRTSNNRAPGLAVIDRGLGVAAVLIAKAPSAGAGNAAQQRDLDRRQTLNALGVVAAPVTRSFTTVEGFDADQASFQIRPGAAMDAATAANQAAAALLGGGPLTGTLQASGAGATVLTVKMLTIMRSPTRVVEVVAFFAGAQPSDPQVIRLEELTDGTNVARHGSFTRHVCDQMEAKAQAKADIIFVVDDSGSMQDDQEAVRAAADAMSQVLTTAQVDFRLGVTRTLATQNPDASRGQLVGGGMTADLEAFKRAIVVGARGGWEPGLQTGIDAIDKLLPRTVAGAPVQAGRLRADAATIVIHLSDERDQLVECQACGVCGEEPSPNTQFCNGPGTTDLINQFVQAYKARNAVTFAIVGDLPNGCRQSNQRNDFEPGQGYVEVANATGGQFGSLCGDMNQNLRDVARVASGVASVYKLSQPPASASIKVAIGPPGHGRVIPRSRVDGFDLDPVQNSVIFYGSSRPQDGDEVVIGYRRWDWANNPQTPPDGCDQCAVGTSCDPTSDLVTCVPICGDTICSDGVLCALDSATCGGTPPDACNGQCGDNQVCLPDGARCVDSCEITGCGADQVCNPTTRLCTIPEPCGGQCTGSLVCDPGPPAQCVTPCEQTGCPGNEVCNPTTHLCTIPDACGGRCSGNMVCDPGTTQCVAPCEQTGCDSNEICDTVTHICTAV